MIIDIVMPKMGESITEGTILEWKKEIGEFVEMDEILLEIGTDKVDSEIPSPAAGKIIEIIGKPNDVFDVGAVIARVESNSDQPKSSNKTQEQEKITLDENKETLSKNEKTIDIPKPNSNKDENNFFTPAVNKIIKKNNLTKDDLLSIVGTGKNNRITKIDVLKFVKLKKNDLVASVNKKLTKPTTEVNAEENLSNEMDHIRKKIAIHMRNSLDTSAHVYVSTEIDMSRIVEYVSEKQNDFKAHEGFNLTFTPFIFQGAVKSLSSFPIMNSSIDKDNVITHKNINIGMAVATDNGLMVPVLSKCEELNFLGLCRKVNLLAKNTRDKKLKPDDLQGSTFSISNFGVFNVTMGTPIINQPNVGIFGIGAIKKRAVVIETNDGDTIGIKSIMVTTLGFDHRLIDGSEGSMFIEDFRKNMENFQLENLF